MDPRVSVLIDSYNYGRFIEEALESVLAQDYPAEQMEVIVVDDGSTDDTAERMKKYGERGVQYFRKENGGQASAFNFGLARARGEIVAFLDADDYWLPGKLKRVVEEFERHPEAGMVYHRLLERSEGTGEMREALFVPLSGYIAKSRDALREYRVYPTSSLSFRRELLIRFGPIPENIRLQADAYIALLAALDTPIQAVSECLAVYRIHGSNLFTSGAEGQTRNRRRQQIETWATIIEEIERWVRLTGADAESSGVRLLLERHRVYQQDMQFALDPPGRIEFFRLLLRKNRLNRDVRSAKLRVVSSLNAWASLITGYRHFRALDEFWLTLDRAKDKFTSMHAGQSTHRSDEVTK